MTRLDLFISAGEALFGARWQSDLAAEMGLSVRYMQMLAAGDRRITGAHLRRALEIVREHSRKLEGVTEALQKEVEKC